VVKERGYGMSDLKANSKAGNLEKAILKGANLKRADHLSLGQLSEVKSLDDTKLDEELFIPLKEEYPTLF
jgi:hypothetical protein